jgi:hypothetical protein
LAVPIVTDSRKFKGGVVVPSSAMSFIPRYIKTEQLLETLKRREYGHTQKYHGVLISLRISFMEGK